MAGQVGGETLPLIAGSKKKKKKTIIRPETRHAGRKKRKVNNANH
jgi:hypothetical protein